MVCDSIPLEVVDTFTVEGTSLYLPSKSTSLMMEQSSCSVGLRPSDLRIAASSFVVMYPLPSLSNDEKASRNSAIKWLCSVRKGVPEAYQFISTKYCAVGTT